MKRNISIIIAISLILLAAISRIVNAQLHTPNFVPIAAIGLFSGAIIKDRRLLAFMVPLLGQFLADGYFAMFTNTPGFYNFFGELFNYLALFGATALGTQLKNIKPVNAMLYTFGASTTFFIISNFGYYLGGLNTYAFSGLVKTYVDAIPFFKNSLGADMMGGVLLFGGYFISQLYFAKKPSKATA